jgi:anti-sigma factor RsiW
MSSPACMAIIPVVKLTEYWLGELDAADEAELEEHLLSCAQCTAQLQRIVQLRDAISRATREGRLHAVLEASFVSKLQADGLRVREYHLDPGGSVACTVAPNDDLVVAHLHASLQDVRQLDLVSHDLAAGTQLRMHDVAFHPKSGAVVLASNVTALRQLTAATLRVRLVSVEDAGEREIGTYTFNHSRYEPRS